MKYLMRSLLAFLCLCSIQPATRLAQTQNPQPATTQNQQKPPDDESVVRISTQLVLIDAVVTDRKGKHLEDLAEEEFELFVDGKKQPLTFFRHVVVPTKPPEKPADAKDKNAPVTPPSMPGKMLAPEKVGRTIAFVVDDLGLSFESTYYTREAIKKFVNQQMQAGDLVGIIRTGRGLGALQQFTSDKRILYAAIDKLTWNPYSRDMMPRFGNNDPLSDPNESAESRQARQEAQARVEDARETIFSVGTLGAVNFVVRGMRELPGRKMVVLMSDGFSLFGRNRDNQQVLDNVRRLVDLANRSSVVIYSLDAKGLQTLMPAAKDNMNGLNGQQIAEQMSQAAQANFDSQEGLSFLARETGGFAILNNNDLNLGIQQVMRDNESYYLLGFDPEDANFDRRYHKLNVRVKRADARVRSRTGFYGIPDDAPRPQPKTRDEQILAAVYSPFGARDLALQMTSFFFNVQQAPAESAAPKPKKDKENKMPEGTVSFVRSLFHIEANNLTLTEGTSENGEPIKQLKLELVAFAFNEQGAITDQHGRSFSFALTEDMLARFYRQGLTYAADIPIKKPGAYQFRAILRDATTGKLGSAGQFIQVPDLNKKRLAMSGLVLSGTQTEEKDAHQPSDPQASPAIRRLPRTGDLAYSFFAYNATIDSATKQPQLFAAVELYQEGKRIHQGPPQPVNLTDQTTPNRIACVGGLRLKNLSPGDYLLRVVVSDKLAKQKYASVDQWMDFSVR
jgi:VWFA-related protein